IHQYKPARGGFDTKKLLSVLEIGEKELKPELEFLPYLSAQTKAKSGFTFSTGLEGTFEKACWIANDLVLTTDQQQQELVLWNLSDCRSLWSLRARFDTVSVSGDGKALLAATAGGICLYDVRSGEQLGVLQGEAGKVRATSFSPDGTRAAVLTGTTLAVYELNSGGLFAEIPRTAGLVEQPIWTDNDNILVGGILYNLEKKLPLCRYTNILPIGSTVAFHRGVVWMVIGMGNKAQLVGNVLPQAELHNKLAELDPKTMFVLSPGASVKMEFELHDLMDEAKVRTLLTERLESKKFTISEASPLTVKVVVMDTGKEVEVGYEQANSRAGMIPPPLMAGRTRELGTVKLKVFAQIIIILSEGKEVWKYGVVTTGPRMVQYDPNKKVEDSIRESNHPEETFVRIAPIPDYIPKSGKSQGALYNAKITPEGIK
ncbi:MAG: hypothetical protein PHQ75_15115, partial [Thermoguttaceae bacterium]|nr:hypothetical protein [Thermoguttaceae bacterium]